MSRVSIVLILAVSAVGIFDRDLWNPHEHRVGAIVREMAESGDYVIPTLGGQPMLHKPPLYYALGAVLLEGVGGDPARTIRLASLLSLLALAATARIVELAAGRDAAVAAAAVLATTLGFLQVGHTIVVDAALVAFVALAYQAFVEVRRGRSAARWLFWVFTGLSLLTKGLVGPALILPGVGLFLLWERDGRGVSGLAPIRGAMLLAAVAALWVVPLYLRDEGETLIRWLRMEMVGRFVGDGTIQYHHDEPFFFYLPGLAVVLLPWTPWFLVGAWHRWRERQWKEGKWREGSGEARDVERLAVCWILTSLVILSLARTKREIYAAPVVPACALLIALWLGRADTVRGRGAWILFFRILLLALVPAMAVAHLAGWLPCPHPGLTFTLGPVVAVLGWLAIRRRAFWLAPAAVAVLAGVLAIPALNEQRSHRRGMRELGELIGDRTVAGWRIGDMFTGSLSFEIDCRPHRFRGRKRLRAWLAEGPEDLLLISRNRWPFKDPPDAKFPGFVRVVRINRSQALVVLESARGGG